jgi:hypothetical protein
MIHEALIHSWEDKPRAVLYGLYAKPSPTADRQSP